jgi:tetratricopeptide (TPR) repeat protein
MFGQSDSRIFPAVILLILTSALLIYFPLAAEAAAGTERELTTCAAGQPAAKTIESCTKVLSLPDIDVPTRANAFVTRGDAYNTIHEWALAIADYKSAQNIKYSPNVAFVLASVDLIVGKNDDSIIELTKIINAGIATAQVFNMRGAAFQNAGKFDASIADFNRVLFLNPTDLTALNNRAAAYAKKGDYAAAVKDLDSVLATNPNMPMALVNRCQLLARDGKFDKGRASCDKAENLDRNSYMTLFGIGGANYDAKHYENAVKYYSRGLQLMPNNPMLLYARGMAQSKLGKDNESNADFSAAERIDPEIAARMATAGMK